MIRTSSAWAGALVLALGCGGSGDDKGAPSSEIEAACTLICACAGGSECMGTCRDVTSSRECKQTFADHASERCTQYCDVFDPQDAGATPNDDAGADSGARANAQRDAGADAHLALDDEDAGAAFVCPDHTDCVTFEVHREPVAACSADDLAPIHIAYTNHCDFAVRVRWCSQDDNGWRCWDSDEAVDANGSDAPSNQAVCQPTSDSAWLLATAEDDYAAGCELPDNPS